MQSEILWLAILSAAGQADAHRNDSPCESSAWIGIRVHVQIEFFPTMHHDEHGVIGQQKGVEFQSVELLSDSREYWSCRNGVSSLPYALRIVRTGVQFSQYNDN